MARRRRGRDRLTLNAEINVVSLIDVMMLLMIIFMITAPMMQGGVDISLPKTESRPLESKSGLTVTIDRTGAVYVDDVRLSFSQFSASFKALANRRGSPNSAAIVSAVRLSMPRKHRNRSTRARNGSRVSSACRSVSTSRSRASVSSTARR